MKAIVIWNRIRGNMGTLRLAAGFALAGLIAGNSIMSYNKATDAAARRTAKSEIADQVRTVDQQIRLVSQTVDDRETLQQKIDAMLDASVKEDQGKLAWVQILNTQGEVIAQAGSAEHAVFNSTELDQAFHEGRTVSVEKHLEQGSVLVEASPLMFRQQRGATLLKAANMGPGGGGRGRPLGSLEVAAYLVPSSEALWGARRNLFLSLTSAFAMAFGLVMLRRRDHSEQKMQRQLDLAGEVQAKMLASSPELGSAFSVATERRTAASVGGDFFDVFTDSEGRAAFALGDVCGKDVPAAMLAGMLQGAIRSHNWTKSAEELKRASVSINSLLFERTGAPSYATMFWGYIDPASSTLQYVNSGHCPAFLIRGSEVIRLTEGGCALGLFPRVQYGVGEVALQAGDMLALYSDGIVESENRGGEEFGEDRLTERLVSAASDSPAAICNSIFQDLAAFSNGPRPSDDQTLVVLRYEGVAQMSRLKAVA